MAYSDADTSVHGGAPIECYKFQGSLLDYRYTSGQEEIILGGELYYPLPVKRKAVRTGTHNDDSLEMVLDVPHDSLLASHYAYDASPPNLHLTVFRTHQGLNPAFDFVVFWQGPVTAFNVSGVSCQLHIPGLFTTVLSSSFPTVHYQNPCNHVLYDSRCKLIRATFVTSSTVSSIGSDGYSVAVVDDGALDNVLRSGEIVITSTGERRLIVDNVANVITLNYPFHTISVGLAVDMTQGCDHSFATCKAKFTNGANYGGFPNIPNDNPFEGTLA